jgi:adenosylcobinamide-GDP ribazoletransferase
MTSPARSLTVALSFLTRLPVARSRPVEAAELARATPFYPVVGLAVGALLAAIAMALPRVPPMLLALLLCAASLVTTGAFHEDGLADSLDGLGGGASRERALEIMKDSRIGTFGAAGLNLLLLARFALYQSIPRPALPVALVAAGCFARFGFLPLMAFLPYARAQGIASSQAQTGLRELAIAAVLPVAVAALGGRASVYALLAALATSALVALWLRARLGGYTGDTLGLCACLCEIASLCCFL